jgi:hypothetical protein
MDKKNLIGPRMMILTILIILLSWYKITEIGESYQMTTKIYTKYKKPDLKMISTIEDKFKNLPDINKLGFYIK